MVVGGTDADPTRRGVVATAYYVAARVRRPVRDAAAHGGEPLPDAVFLPADKPAYEAASERVMAVLRGFAGVDRRGAWAGTRRSSVPPWPTPTAAEELARRIQAAVAAETRLTCAVGIGDNLLRAKIATEFGKPGGRFTLTAENWVEVMGHRPTRALWGIGAKTAAKLAERGITTVDELAAADPEALAAELGPGAGPLVRAAGARDRPGRGARRAVGRALARAGGDLPGRPHRLGGRARGRRHARAPRRRRRAGRGQARRARGRQGAVRPVHDEDAQHDAAGADVRHRDAGGGRARGAGALHTRPPVRLVGVRAELAATPPPPRRSPRS